MLSMHDLFTASISLVGDTKLMILPLTILISAAIMLSFHQTQNLLCHLLDPVDKAHLLVPQNLANLVDHVY